MEPIQKLFNDATLLLSRREHSSQELMQKLTQKGYTAAEVESVLVECQRLGLQDDQRFVQSRCRLRIRQGYGPRRISQELLNLGIARADITAVLTIEEQDWLEHALTVWRKKFAKHRAENFAAVQKQKQFLYQRGFAAETIAEVFAKIT